MAASRSLYVVDANILIQLDHGGILEAFFRLPFSFLAPDVIIAELRGSPSPRVLAQCGLRSHELGGKQVALVYVLRQRYPKPSVNDLFALVSAMELGCAVLTGDANLRRAAESEGVAAAGLLSILDEMINHGILKGTEAVKVLQKILDRGARLPLDECRRRMRIWTQRP